MADVVDNVVTAGSCALGNQNACAGLQASILIPAPTGTANLFVDSFEDFSRAWSRGALLPSSTVANQVVNVADTNPGVGSSNLDNLEALNLLVANDPNPSIIIPYDTVFSPTAITDNVPSSVPNTNMLFAPEENLWTNAILDPTPRLLASNPTLSNYATEVFNSVPEIPTATNLANFPNQVGNDLLNVITPYAPIGNPIAPFDSGGSLAPEFLFSPSLSTLPNDPAGVIMDDLLRPLPDVDPSLPRSADVDTLRVQISNWWDNTVGDLNLGGLGNNDVNIPENIPRLDIEPDLANTTNIKTGFNSTEIVKISYTSDLDPLIKIKEIENTYGNRLRIDLETNNADDLMAIAREKGYSIKMVEIGRDVSVIENGRSTMTPLKYDNSVRIGSDNVTLYVGVHPNRPGLVFDIKDLAHDVGAILLGGKISSNGSPFVPVDIIRQMFVETGNNYSISQIHEVFGGFHPINGTQTVPDTWILDQIIAGNESVIKLVLATPNKPSIIESVLPQGVLNLPTALARVSDAILARPVRNGLLIGTPIVVINAVIIDDLFDLGIVDWILDTFNDVFNGEKSQGIQSPLGVMLNFTGSFSKNDLPKNTTNLVSLINLPDLSTKGVDLTSDTVPDDYELAVFLTDTVNDFYLLQQTPEGRNQILQIINQSGLLDLYPFISLSVYDGNGKVTQDNKDTFGLYIIAMAKLNNVILNQATADFVKPNNSFVRWYDDDSGKFQISQCVIWQNLLDRMFPELNLAKIGGFTFENTGKGIEQASDVFRLINSNKYSVVDGGRLYINPTGNIQIFEFTDITKVQKGDTCVYGGGVGHMCTILDRYEQNGKLYFLVSEANSPNGLLDGTPQTYLVDEIGFMNLIGLKNTLFLRSNTAYLDTSLQTPTQIPDNFLIPTQQAPVNSNIDSGNNDINLALSITQAAQEKMQTCVPAKAGYYNACVGEYFNNEILNSTNGISVTYSELTPSIYESYWCTQLVFDAAEAAGLTFEDKEYSAYNLHRDMSVKGSVVDTEVAELSGDAIVGNVAFVSADIGGTLTVIHVGIVSEVIST